MKEGSALNALIADMLGDVGKLKDKIDGLNGSIETLVDETLGEMEKRLRRTADYIGDKTTELERESKKSAEETVKKVAGDVAKLNEVSQRVLEEHNKTLEMVSIELSEKLEEAKSIVTQIGEDTRRKAEMALSEYVIEHLQKNAQLIADGALEKHRAGLNEIAVAQQKTAKTIEDMGIKAEIYKKTFENTAGRGVNGFIRECTLVSVCTVVTLSLGFVLFRYIQ